MRLVPLVVALLSAAPAAAQTLLIGNKGEDTISFIDLKSGRELRRSRGSPPRTGSGCWRAIR